MAQTFSISQRGSGGRSDSALRDEIQAHTQNALETSRILSAIQRFGSDPSIDRFELIPSASRGRMRSSPSVAGPSGGCYPAVFAGDARRSLRRARLRWAMVRGPDMVFFNHSTMQMAAKIVYYGPGLCGKTTNLQHIYNHTSRDSRGEMVSLETDTDRTLFFDLLPIEMDN